MKKRKHIITILVVLCIAAIGSVAGMKVFAEENDNRTICNGIFINTVDVGGMTEDEAREAVAEYIKAINAQKVVVTVDDNRVETTVGTFGYTSKADEVIETALNFGKSGNFIKRYKEIKDLENDSLVLTLQAEVDKEAITAFVESQCNVFNILAEDAQLSRQNGVFVVTQHKMGRKVEVEATAEKIISALLNDWDYRDLEIDAVVMSDEPLYTSEKLALCKDILGTFETTYTSSSASRASNLANGARLINGSVIWPEEIFSVGKALSPITEANGYSIAGAYQSGQVIDSIGGGVCQVSTTLYNAALMAELEIEERSNHSMIVGYVKPAMDAAIAGDYKDLKIKNNTDVPIYIEATTVGRTITFTIYGHETRDTVNRKVEYESKVLEVIQPGKEKVTEDKTQPPTYRKVTQTAHVGYKAELWKVVYENGKEVSRERVNYSSYAAEPAYVTVGTKEEKKEEIPEDEEEPTESPEPLEKPSKKPSPTPENTPAPTPEPDEPLDVDEDLIDQEEIE